MSYGSIGRPIYCPRCGARVGRGAASAHLLACGPESEAEEAADWQPIETAPRDGAEILTQARNGFGRGAWMAPSVVRWRQNAIPDAWIQAFWSDAEDTSGNPMPCYHMPLRWRPL